MNFVRCANEKEPACVGQTPDCSGHATSQHQTESPRTKQKIITGFNQQVAGGGEIATASPRC